MAKQMASVEEASAVGFGVGTVPGLEREVRVYNDEVRCLVILVPTKDVDDVEIPASAIALMNKPLNLDCPKANDELLRSGGVKGSYSILHGSMADAEEGIILKAIIDGTLVSAPLTLNVNLSMQSKQVPASVKAVTLAANEARRLALVGKDGARAAR